MKLKNLTAGWVVVFIVLLGISGCEKFEDGRSLSLAKMKSYLVGEWKINKYNGGVINTPWIKTFMSDGKYKEVLSIVTGDVKYEGTWEISENKEMVYVIIGNVTSSCKIIRLTSNEFNYQDDDGNLFELTK